MKGKMNRSKSKLISVFEQGILKKGEVFDGAEFKDCHFDALAKFHDKTNTPFFSLLREGIRFKEYVGVINIGNLTIEVLPKADNSNDKIIWREKLIDMLKKVGEFRISASSKANLKIKPNHILELYILQFINEVEQLIHKGLVRQYRSIDENLITLRGSIVFSKHIPKNFIHQERFYVRHITYDKEHDFNKIIFKAISLIRNINTNFGLQGLIGELELSFPELHDIKVNEELFARLKYTRKTEHYRNAIEIARLLLLNYHPDLSHGKNHVLALMFNMNLLWEKFVYVSLRKYLKANKVLFQQSAPYWKLKYQRAVRIKPDIIVLNNGAHYVIDTKWKLLYHPRPTDDDLKQMYAYTKYFHSDHTIICYPGYDDFLEGYFYDEENQEQKYKCSIVTIGVDRNLPISKWQERISLRIREAIES